MIIPKRLKDGPKTISVEYVTPLQHEDAGSYCHHASAIQLWRINKKEGYDEAEQSETLMHEMVERVNAESDLGLKHYQIVAISTSLFRLIRDSGLNFADKTVEEDQISNGS